MALNTFVINDESVLLQFIFQHFYRILVSFPPLFLKDVCAMPIIKICMALLDIRSWDFELVFEFLFLRNITTLQTPFFSYSYFSVLSNRSSTARGLQTIQNSSFLVWWRTWFSRTAIYLNRLCLKVTFTNLIQEPQQLDLKYLCPMMENIEARKPWHWYLTTQHAWVVTFPRAAS